MQRHSVTSLETARSLANDSSGGGWGEFPGNCSVSYLSFVYGSTGGVCGRVLMVGKILFTGRQTCGRKQDNYEKLLVIGWWNDDIVLDNTFLKMNTFDFFIFFGLIS